MLALIDRFGSYAWCCRWRGTFTREIQVAGSGGGTFTGEIQVAGSYEYFDLYLSVFGLSPQLGGRLQALLRASTLGAHATAPTPDVPRRDRFLRG